MKIKLNNIGSFNETSIEINGITVVAGENATGKSTVGKALYSVFHSFSSYKKKINKIRHQNFGNILRDIVGIQNFLTLNGRKQEQDNFIDDLIINSEKYLKNETDIFNVLYVFLNDNFENVPSRTVIKEGSKKILESLKITDENILHSIIQDNLNREFNNEIVNKYNGNICSLNLKIKDDEIKIVVVDNKVKEVENSFELVKDAVYIDDPYILDDLNQFSNHFFFDIIRGQNHRNDLVEKIKTNNVDDIERIKINNKIDHIFSNLNGINLGNLLIKNNIYKYNDPSKQIDLDVRNIATGLKSFIIIKTLLENGTLDEKGLIILDEPEIHLHPKWQMVLAELIVLIQKEFNMHILLNTHSPYFLRAIQVYTKKHNIKERTKYYLSSNVDNISYLEEVTENVDLIYALLVEPFDRLDEENENV